MLGKLLDRVEDATAAVVGLIPALAFNPVAHLFERRFFGGLHDATCSCVVR